MLEDIRRIDDELPVVMITAFGTIESAVAATKQGAFHYFTKPFKNDEVLACCATRSSAGGSCARTASCATGCDRARTGSTRSSAAASR